LNGMPGRGTLETEKPPIVGLVPRGGTVIVHRRANVRPATIQPLILAGVALGRLINTDEDAIDSRLLEWGFGHQAVHQGRGESARDAEGDGFGEVHVNTLEILCWRSMSKMAVDHRSRAGEHAGPSVPVKPRAPRRAPPVGQGLDRHLLGPARA
jgi:hypothetical protein